MPGDFGEFTVNIGLGINFLAGGTLYLNSNDTLSYALTHFNALWSVEAHFYGANLVLPYFSSLSMVAVSVPFPEARNRKGTESGLCMGRNFKCPEMWCLEATMSWVFNILKQDLSLR